jgi:hypothetical protein
MDDIRIITAYCIISDTLYNLGHKSHRLATVTDAEVLTVLVVSAMYFHNNHERALFVMYHMRYLSNPLSTSRFNRRVHSLAQCLEYITELVGQLFAKGEAFIIDSLPIPVCQIVRARRCRKLNGAQSLPYFGWCSSKRWHFFGWRLHLICTPGGVPVRFQMLPASFHDLTPIYELTFGLPKGASVFADKAYISAPVRRALRPTVRRGRSKYSRDGVHLVARHKQSMRPNTFLEWCGLRLYRHTIESANSQLVRMGIQSLHARTDQGLAIKVLASLLALTCINSH